MRRFVQPPFLRRVTMALLLGWFIPFLGSLGAGIFFAGVRDEPVKDGIATRTEAAGENLEENKSLAENNQKKQGRMENERAASAVAQPDPAGDGAALAGAGRPAGVNTASSAGTEWSSPAAPAAGNPAATRQSSGPSMQGDGGNNNNYNEDLALLARVIYAEARGEPLEGQVAVGAVLLNRVKSPNFPNNLWSIIFRSGEFCTVRDGQIWLEPDAKAYRAAQLALNGWDPTNGALFFYNPARTTSRWIWSRPVTTKIGRHIFAR